MRLAMLPECQHRECGNAALAEGSYNPGALLDFLLEHMRLGKDSQLAHRLDIHRRLLGRIRKRQINISGSMLIVMHEASGIPVAALKQMSKDRRKTSRMECRRIPAGHAG